MAEKIASLKKKGGGKEYGENLFSFAILPAATTGTTWTQYPLVATLHTPDSTSIIQLDSNFAHFDNDAIVVDKAVPKAYFSGSAYSFRNSGGTSIYSGVRFKKNGTVISGTEVMGSSGTNPARFRLVQTSLAVGDVITVEYKFSASANVYAYTAFINIVSDY